jgi:hypothetical protein
MRSSLERKNCGGTGELLIEAVTAPRRSGRASSIPQVCYLEPLGLIGSSSPQESRGPKKNRFVVLSITKSNAFGALSELQSNLQWRLACGAECSLLVRGIIPCNRRLVSRHRRRHLGLTQNFNYQQPSVGNPYPLKPTLFEGDSAISVSWRVSRQQRPPLRVASEPECVPSHSERRSSLLGCRVRSRACWHRGTLP